MVYIVKRVNVMAVFIKSSYYRINKGLGGTVATGDIIDIAKSDFEVLRPKGPEPALMKLFNEFLRQLARSLGVKSQDLQKQGYRCENVANQVRYAIPNSDHLKAFEEMRQTGKNPKFETTRAEKQRKATNDLTPLKMIPRLSLRPY